MASVSDTGVSDSDAITRDRIPVFEASADQDGILTIHDHGHLLYDQPISAGTSNVFLDDLLADGEHIFDVRLAADGEEESLAFRVIIDNLGPEVVDTVARPNPDGLIAFYDFDGTLDDTSGHGRMATATGDNFVTAGYQGQGFHFDGTDDYVSLPVNINPSVYPQITIGAWVRADTDESETRAILSHDHSGGKRGLFLEPDSEGAVWSAGTGGADTLTSEDLAESGEWTFIAVSYDQDSESAVLYVDDSVVPGPALIGNPLGQDHVLIGYNPVSDVTSFIGTIDNVFFYDSVLTEAQVAYVREGGVHAIRPNAAEEALAYYDFESGPDDLSGHQFDGYNSAAIHVDDGYFGNAYEFDGATSRIDLPLQWRNLRRPQMTVGAWVLVNSAAADQTVMSIDWYSSEGTLITHYSGATDQVVWALDSDEGIFDSGTPVVANRWTFIAATFDGLEQTAVLHVDDAEYGFDYDGPWGNYWADQIVLGARAHHGTRSDFLAGKIDEVFFVDRVLGNRAITDIRARGVQGALRQQDRFTATFQQDHNGYADTHDTFLMQDDPFAKFADNSVVNVLAEDTEAGIGEEQGLLRFDELFGYFPGQIPRDDEVHIESATLELHTVDAGSGATLHRLERPWDDTGSWVDWGDGVQADGTEASATPELVIDPTDYGAVRFDVTQSITDWQIDPDSNHGWVLFGNGVDRWSFDSSESVLPPKLVVTYSLPAEIRQVASPYDEQYFVFNEAALLDPLFAPAEVVEVRRAGTDVPPGDLSGQNALWRIGFADPQPAGIYDFAIFEESGDFETYHDLAGNAMDQNRNGRGAEWNEDYRFAVEVLAPDAGNDLLIELDPEDDSGRFDSDNITNITSPQFVATLDIDGTLEVDFDNDGTFDYAQWHAAGQHAMQSGELTDGVHTIAARLTTDSGVISTDEVAITIDTAAPQVREFTGEDFDVVLDADQLEIGFDEALAMDSDSVTGTANYEIVTSGGDGIFGNGNDVDLSARINQLTYMPDSGGGRVTIALAPALRGELYRITAIGTTSIQDIAGNHLGGGFDFSIERQIHEDATITLDLPADQDSGVSDTDDLTRIAAPTVAVEVNIAGIIHLYSEDNTVDVTETVPNGGIVSLTVNQALPDGAHTLTADFTPPGGDPVSTQLDLTIDTQSPGIRLEQLGNALWFDGVDDYVATPLNIDQGGSTPGLTFEAWVYPTTDSGAHIVISSDNGGWDWSMEQNGATWAVFNGSGRWDTGFAVDVNQWQHVAAVFIPGTGVEFYKNGQRAFNSGIGYDGSDRAVAIGRNPGYGSYFAGAIDEVRVWNRPRSEAEPAARSSCQL